MMKTNSSTRNEAIDAEKGVLGSLLLRPDEVIEIARKKGITRETFYVSAHGEIFETVLRLHEAGNPVDFITIARDLQTRERLDQVGGAAAINELFIYLPTAANAEYYMGIALDAQRSRRISSLLRSIASAHEQGETLNGEVHELAQLVESAHAARARASLPFWKDAIDLIISRPPLPDELIEGILHRGSKLVLGGSSKSNKTWSLLDMAISVAGGHPWWGFNVHRGRVLYLNMEIAECFFTKRIYQVLEAKNAGLDKGDLTIWSLRGHACDIGRLSEQVLPEIKAGGFSLIILDPIYKCLGDRDENAAGEIAGLLNEIERIAVEANCAVAFGAHYSKGNQSAKEAIDRIGGSGVFARDPDAILTMTAHEEPGAFVVEPILRNHAPIEPFVVRWNWPLMNRDEDLNPEKLRQPGGPGRPKKHDSEKLVKLLALPKTTKELMQEAKDELGMSRATFFRAIDELEECGTIGKNSEGEWRKLK